jgi:uncharacterized membrane protein
MILNQKQKKKYQFIWITISLIAVLSMVAFLLIPLIQ